MSGSRVLANHLHGLGRRASHDRSFLASQSTTICGLNAILCSTGQQTEPPPLTDASSPVLRFRNRSNDYQGHVRGNALLWLYLRYKKPEDSECRVHSSDRSFLSQFLSRADCRLGKPPLRCRGRPSCGFWLVCRRHYGRRRCKAHQRSHALGWPSRRSCFLNRHDLRGRTLRRTALDCSHSDDCLAAGSPLHTVTTPQDMGSARHFSLWHRDMHRGPTIDAIIFRATLSASSRQPLEAAMSDKQQRLRSGLSQISRQLPSSPKAGPDWHR